MSNTVAKKTLDLTAETLNALIEKDTEYIGRVASIIVSAFKSGGKVLTCGNGGGAANASHLANDLVGRFKRERPGLPAVAMVTDPSTMTAISNDFGYENVFARQVQALGKQGDVLVAYSSSGTSPNALNAAKMARKLNMNVVAFTGVKENPLADMSDVAIRIDSNDPACVEDISMIASHVICQLVESELFPEAPPRGHVSSSV